MTSERETDFLDEMADKDEAQGEAGDTGEQVEKETDKPETKDETAQGEPEKATKVEPPATEDKDSGHVPLAALKAERTKRQALERELEQLRSKATQTQPQQQPQEAQQPASFYEDPERFVQGLVSKVQHEANQRILQALDAEAREQFPDYDEVMELVVKQAEGNPAIRQQILNSPNPPKAAYRLGKQLKDLEAMQDPVAYRAAIEAEVRAKVEAELRAKQEAKRKATDAIPPDLAAETSRSGKDQPAADPFESMFIKE